MRSRNWRSGVTARWSVIAMLHGRLLGLNNAQELARLARGMARNKRLELIAALDGHRMTEAQRSLIRRSLRHLEFLAQEIESLDSEIRGAVEAAGLQDQMEWLQTIPGIQEYTAASILVTEAAWVGLQNQGLRPESDVPAPGATPGQEPRRDRSRPQVAGDRLLRPAAKCAV